MIAALHAAAPTATATDWPQIAALYGELEARYPSPVVSLNRAVALAMVEGPAAGLACLAPLGDALAEYHLWHAARAELLRRAGELAAARAAYVDALRFVGTAPERRFLERRIAALDGTS